MNIFGRIRCLAACRFVVRPTNPGFATFARPLTPSKFLRLPEVTEVHIPPTRLSATPNSATSIIDVELNASFPASFSKLKLKEELLVALSGLNITEPTEIQTKAVPAILSGGDYVLASHTGSGKTLSYLLPLVHLIKLQEQDGFIPKPKRPRVLILGPTKELAEQIAGVAKALCHAAKFRAACLTGSTTKKQQQVKLLGPIDIVVATPTRFLQHVKDGNIFYKDINWLVIDEADTILGDETWAKEVRTILTPLRSRVDRPKAQVVLVSATMSKPIRRLIATDFPGIRMIETSSLHKGIAGSKHQFVTLPSGRDKLDVLDDVIAPSLRQQGKVLVFCNTMDSCRAVEHHMREAGVNTVCYHGDMPVHLRQEAMRKFAGQTPREAEEDEEDEFEMQSENGLMRAKSRQQRGASSSGRCPVMIATDVAARGLDFPGQVDHVINFDFPSNPVDYIHRGGRTARAGRTGRVTSIVGSRDRTLAQRIEWALDHSEPLDQLSAEKHILPPSQRPKPGAEKEKRKLQGAPKGTKGAARNAAPGVVISRGRASSGATSSRRGDRKGPPVSSAYGSSSATAERRGTGNRSKPASGASPSRPNSSSSGGRPSSSGESKLVLGKGGSAGRSGVRKGSGGAKGSTGSKRSSKAAPRR
ncbi:hypothetical protein CEUSTIGMA_g6044.t1 [Chlamydomonas eustigma]|uniref:RNA helicase n=1 Tax=Chlamydomonas eustigma TaxID=1157962 RepID=A0A250X6B1_9CHLO|nr:hypothetical protein CEUSTIGMA_g6044.t1 [Chlamydomonas eustigma]|eukprot:GAX78605.1 hypothetical protein CEUSTIGMA_g6044.t1 [Chlamydomonas eustigma]